jgi:hypothetical protein
MEAVQRAKVIDRVGEIQLLGVAVTHPAMSVTLNAGQLIAEFALGDYVVRAHGAGYAEYVREHVSPGVMVFVEGDPVTAYQSSGVTVEFPEPRLLIRSVRVLR